MQAAWYEANGPADEVLIVGERPDPVPCPNGVRVRLFASGLNPADAKRRSGWGRLKLEYPWLIPHDDGAGVIDAVGELVSPDRVGERVWVYDARLGTQTGTAAELVCVPEYRVEPLPGDVSFAVGASVGVPGRTAHRCLFSDRPIGGAVVLVAGAAGAVGHSAVQQAKIAGATVIGTVGNQHSAEVARQAGCDLVLNYRTDDMAEAVLQYTNGAGVQHIVEVDLAANIDVDSRVCATNGTIAMYATDSDHHPQIPLWRLMNKSINLRCVLLYNLTYAEHRLAADDLNKWLRSRQLNVRLGKTFSLDQIVDAHHAVEQRTGDGNIVVEMAP